MNKEKKKKKKKRAITKKEMITSPEQLKALTEHQIVRHDPEEEVKKTFSEKIKEKLHSLVYGKKQNDIEEK